MQLLELRITVWCTKQEVNEEAKYELVRGLRSRLRVRAEVVFGKKGRRKRGDRSLEYFSRKVNDVEAYNSLAAPTLSLQAKGMVDRHCNIINSKKGDYLEASVKYCGRFLLHVAI